MARLLVLRSYVRAALACAFAASVLAVAGPVSDATTATADIASAGPLTHVYIGNDLACQVAHAADGSVLQFYYPGQIPGDCGTFLVTGGVLYSPAFNYTSATGSLGTKTPFTTVSQSAVTGAGTAADPFKVVTVVTAGTTGLRLTETDSYVVGRESYRTGVEVANMGAAAADITLYRAGDCFLGGSDFGYGFVVAKAVACSKNANNTPPGRVEQWVPITADSKYFHNHYGTVWAKIGSKTPFNDTCRCAQLLDNGAGLSWTAQIAVGGRATFSHITNFGRSARATTLSANPAAADVSTSPAVFLNLSATLKDDVGAPVVGRPVEFSVGGTLACTGTTNSSGLASCGGPVEVVSVLLAGGYQALFPGDSEYLASVGDAPFARVLGEDVP